MIDKNGLRLNSNNLVIQDKENAEKMRDILNQKGCGFCLAKWSQVTIHLANGLTHSCHHTRAHSIPLEELEKNPSALHNTLFKKSMRKMMLNDQKPEECNYCWRIEDNNNISDRVYKSMQSWSYPQLDEIKNSTGDEDVYPKYVEVSFNNTCNFKCSYCSPKFSSKWQEEINQLGYTALLKDSQYQQLYNSFEETKILNSEENPYIEAWWKWFPDALPHMHTLRITGGEPLLIKDTFKVIDFLIENPNPNLEFAINTNLCPPDKLWDEFLIKIDTLIKNKCVKEFLLFTSLEAEGIQAEYIRTGLDIKLFKERTHEYLTKINGSLVFMSAFNILSIPSFKEFLEWVLDLKKNYNINYKKKSLEKLGYTFDGIPFNQRFDNDDNPNRVRISIPYVKSPSFLDAGIITGDLVQKYMFPALEFISNNLGIKGNSWTRYLGFQDIEVDNLIRIVEDILQKCPPGSKHFPFTSDRKISIDRAKFYDYVNDHDRRRNTNFLKTFPEFKDFYNVCKEEKEKLLKN